MARGSPVPRAIGLGGCAAIALAAGAGAGGCQPRDEAGVLPSRPVPVCPRDARPDDAGRCACVAGTLPALGACVPPDVGDAFCGKAQRLGLDGCSFRTCAADEVLDVATGMCTPRLTLPFGMPARGCADGAAPIVERGRPACVPLEAACPRGTGRVRVDGAPQACVRPATCPPGTLVDFRASAVSTPPTTRKADACLPIVTAGAGTPSVPRVDVGAWAALVWGTDGGIGSAELCRPLAQQPAAFGVTAGQRLALRLALHLEIPDQDVTRAAASARVTPVALTALEAVAGGDASTDGGRREGSASASASLGPDGGAGAGPRVLPPGADDVVQAAVSGLLEPLRSLGGHASSAAVEVEVRCVVASL